VSELPTASRRRLARMGVDLWRLRSGLPSADDLASDADTLRVRLLSGSGDWVLVQKQAWRGDHSDLMADIQATIGVERCRFGQWAEVGSAGVGPAELRARGVRYVLSFGPPPDLIDWSILIQAPSLDDLVDRAEARRELWQRLAPAIGD